MVEKTMINILHKSSQDENRSIRVYKVCTYKIDLKFQSPFSKLYKKKYEKGELANLKGMG